MDVSACTFFHLLFLIYLTPEPFGFKDRSGLPHPQRHYLGGLVGQSLPSLFWLPIIVIPFLLKTDVAEVIRDHVTIMVVT